MNLLHAIIFLITLPSSCGAIKEKKEIKGVKYTTYFPIVSMDGKLDGYDTLTKLLYFKGNQVVLNFNYKYDSFEDGKFVKSEWKRFYFTFSKGAKYGLVFEDSNYRKGQKVLADSILKLNWPTVYIDTVISEKRNIVRFINKNFDADSGILTEKYEVQDGIDTATNINIILRYSNKLNIKEYSFSKTLDSVRQMKLYYCKVTVKPRYFGKENYLMDSFDTVIFFEEMPVINQEELLYYFEQGEKMDADTKKN